MKNGNQQPAGAAATGSVAEEEVVPGGQDEALPSDETTGDEVPAEDEAAAPDGEHEPEEVLHGLPAATQGKIQKRFGVLTAQARTAQEEAETAKAEAAAEKERADAAEKAVNDEAMRAALGQGLLPEYISAPEAAAVAAATRLEQDEAWLESTLESCGTDGYEAGNGTVYSRAQLSTRLREVRSELRRVGYRAEQIRERAWREAEEDRKAGRALRLKGGATRTTTTSAAGRPAVAAPAPRTRPGLTAGARVAPVRQPGARAAFSAGRVQEKVSKGENRERVLESEYLNAYS